MSREHAIELFSMVMLFISCTGVFEPLEVALNSVWGFKSRNYLMNQLVSLGLALGCGVLAFARWRRRRGSGLRRRRRRCGWSAPGRGRDSCAGDVDQHYVATIVLKTFGLVAAILIFFLIYWLLPNGKIAVQGGAAVGDHHRRGV